MKKTILIMIALTIAGNAGAAACLRNMKSLTKSMTKVNLYKQNGMATHLRLEISSARFFAINVISECTGDKKAMKGARAMGKRALKVFK